MSEFPKLARERLAAQQEAAPAMHPDADLLAAFAEQSLSGAEREQVLAHLATCSQCREVVALAFPASDESAFTATAVEKSRAWHEWWVFRWGGLISALAVVLVAVYLARPRARMGQVAEAPETRNAPVPAALPPAVQTAVPSPAAPAIVEKKRLRTPAGKKSERTTTEISSSANAGQKVTTNAAPAANAPAMADEAVAAQSAARSSAAKSAKVTESQSPAMAAKPAEVRRFPPVVGGPYTAGAPARGEAAGLAKARPVAAMTRWSISESGTLQRSDDGGRTWKDVELSGAAGIRTVTAAGSDVWAGGVRGALFHSPDGGDHWARVAVIAGGQPLTGDITRVEIAGPGALSVLTSTAEKWLTSDAGATWTLAPAAR